MRAVGVGISYFSAVCDPDGVDGCRRVCKKGLTCLKVVMMGLVLCRAGAAAMSLNIAQTAQIGSGGGACRSQHSAGTAGWRSARKLYRLLAKARVGNSSSSRRESESCTGFWGTGRATSRLGRRLRPSRLPLAAVSLRPRTAPPPRPPLSFSSSGCWHWNALKTKGLITRAAIWLFCFSSAHEEEMRDVYGALCHPPIAYA